MPDFISGLPTPQVLRRPHIHFLALVAAFGLAGASWAETSNLDRATRLNAISAQLTEPATLIGYKVSSDPQILATSAEVKRISCSDDGEVTATIFYFEFSNAKGKKWKTLFKIPYCFPMQLPGKQANVHDMPAKYMISINSDHSSYKTFEYVRIGRFVAHEESSELNTVGLVATPDGHVRPSNTSRYVYRIPMTTNALKAARQSCANLQAPPNCSGAKY